MLYKRYLELKEEDKDNKDEEKDTAGEFMVANWDLKGLLRNYKESHGVNRMVAMEYLRQYMRATPMMMVKEEIERITDEEDLNILIGVGLRGVLWYVAINQKSKMLGVY